MPCWLDVDFNVALKPGGADNLPIYATHRPEVPKRAAINVSQGQLIVEFNAAPSTNANVVKEAA